VELTSTHFDKIENSMIARFTNPDLKLICTPDQNGVTLSWNANRYPPNSWFALAAKAGNAVTNVDPGDLEIAAHRCHQAALKSEHAHAVFEVSSARIVCMSGSKDVGFFILTIWIEHA